MEIFGSSLDYRTQMQVVQARVVEAPATTQNRQLSNEPVAVETQIVDTYTSNRRNITSEWNGLVTPDGGPFHDLSPWRTGLTRPTRALRYVNPDEKHRIPRDIAQRVLKGM